MMLWRAEVHVWPHSTDRGGGKDQADAGERVQHICFRAEDFDGACVLAKMFAAGIRCNPMVWKAPIMKLERISE